MKTEKGLFFELSREEIKEILDDARYIDKLHRQKGQSKGFFQDGFDAAIKKLFNEIKDLHDFRMSSFPILGDVEMEFELEMLDRNFEYVALVVISINSAAVNPVSIRIPSL